MTPAELEDFKRKYKRLVQFYDEHVGTPCEQIRHEQQIEQLNSQIVKLRRALGPFARFAKLFNNTAREDGWQLTRNPSGTNNLTMGDVRAARDTLEAL